MEIKVYVLYLGIMLIKDKGKIIDIYLFVKVIENIDGEVLFKVI